MTQESMTPTQRITRLRNVQDEIDRLLRERDQLIVETDGLIGVRELGRWLGLSGAQVSRIRHGQTQRSRRALQDPEGVITTDDQEQTEDVDAAAIFTEALRKNAPRVIVMTPEEFLAWLEQDEQDSKGR